VVGSLARTARDNRGEPVVERAGVYGFVATLQPSADFGRILAAYGGIFVAGSLTWA
jgi:drug/metabolite transporter superfamily protein YnfA